jgi:GNAT superfamily N-acetyltransferase
VSRLAFRDGSLSDLRATFELGDGGGLPERERPLVEFMAAQPDGRDLICEDAGAIVGYARVVRFGTMEHLTDLWVAPSHTGRGVGRALLERCWPESPTRELGRVVLGLGSAADLSLYTEFGVMPVSGHWHLGHRADEYTERRSQELDVAEPAVHALTAARAVAEWQRLEPSAIGHERPRLHEFFGRTRTCLATVDDTRGQAVALCWVSSEGEIGPAVAEEPAQLVPVVLAALDRVAKQQEPETVGVACITDAWWLLDRLRRLGFHVRSPNWVMCSVPLPGLDRYLPTRPARLL